MPKLVIVESPAKAKTIGKYLGRGYKGTASMGHVRDLPASTLGIDVENGYTPKYITIKGKQKLVKELKAEAKKCDGVLLATDPDREGEAISWHLANILGLDPSAPNRVTFDEITKKGVKEGMAHPRAINIDLFNAQQARRELDRLVGYKLSPFLWKKIRRGLSAGRVQSVAVRLIRDRELEIENFKPDEYWNIDALLNPQGEKGEFTARLAATADGKKLTVTNKQQADGILAALDGRDYTITKIEKGKRRRQPSPPFITSTLQQDASRAFGFSATRTMRAAQTLYEGVDIAGHGTVGLITYMRTDSLRIAAEAQAAAKTFIAERWGDNYVCKTARKWKSRSATAAQDAHEAIRPSMPELTPDEVEQSISGDTAKLYRLVRRLHRAVRGIHRRCQKEGDRPAPAGGGPDPQTQKADGGPEVHPAAAALHRGHADPRAGGKRHRTPVHLCAYHHDHRGPRLCGEGPEEAENHPARAGRQHGHDGAVPRHCQREIQR